MQKQDTWTTDDDDDEPADRQTASLAGIAVTLVLIVVALFLVHELQAKGALEDCLMSGRTNCDVVLGNQP